MNKLSVVLDTNVLVAGLRSNRGASFQLLHMTVQGRFEIVLSAALVLEYEAVLLAQRAYLGLSSRDIKDFLDYLCVIGRHQKIYYLWRPQLRDPKDEMVLELAVAGNVNALITHNVRDFSAMSGRFTPRLLTPAQFLEETKS
jgi:putative PIN family toxin of toxin-antitoxin system